jgi:hypothetical protein
MGVCLDGLRRLRVPNSPRGFFKNVDTPAFPEFTDSLVHEMIFETYLQLGA